MSFSSVFKPTGCCPYRQPNTPQAPQNLIKIVMYGFVYTETPVFFNANGEMINLQYHADINNLTYMWTFYHPDMSNINSLKLVLVTSEDVMPVIYEEITQRYMKVEKLERWNGRTRWLLHF
jgi:hypothetical protein